MGKPPGPLKKARFHPARNHHGEEEVSGVSIPGCSGVLSVFAERQDSRLKS
jgi:hypothetical protein